MRLKKGAMDSFWKYPDLEDNILLSQFVMKNISSEAIDDYRRVMKMTREYEMKHIPRVFKPGGTDSPVAGVYASSLFH